MAESVVKVGPGPAVVQAPGWVQEDGHDLPISPEKPAIHEELREVLDASPLGSSHALVREFTGGREQQIPIYPGYTYGNPSYIGHRSFLGSTLMALLNLSPFLNFIEEAANSHAFTDPIFDGLHALAQAFRRRGGELEDEEWQEGVWSLVETFWQCITAEGETQVELFQDDICQVPEFLNYLLGRLEHAQLRQGQVGGGDDVNLSIRFKQLFKYFTVRLTPMRCSCAQPVLRRQATGHNQPTDYLVTAQVPEGMNLELAISRAMWEKRTESLTRTCPECGDGVKARDFNTFAYLPEVFFVFPVFLSRRRPDGRDFYTQDEKFTYPEWLDMSALADAPERPGDQTDRIYKLQSIITCSNQDEDWRTMYKSALRLDNRNWVQYEYDASSQIRFKTLEEINDRSEWDGKDAPHLLMYVRDHHAEASGILPGAVKPQPNPPLVNSEIYDKYGAESSDLWRFVEAQGQAGEIANTTAFDNAKSELGKGRKTSYWMWYMFPHIRLNHILRSRLGALFEIKSLGEVIAYWKHSLLKSRYLSLLRIVLNGPETDLEKLFGKFDAEKFHASLTLFVLTCDDNDRDLFQQVFKKFDKQLHEKTVWILIPWLHGAGEKEAIAWIADYAGINAERASDHSDGGDGKQEIKVPDRGGLSTLVTSAKALAYGKKPESGDGVCHGNCSGTNPSSEAAQNIYSELLRLAESDVDNGDYSEEALAEFDARGELFGKVILGFAVPKGAPSPVDTPESRERARRLGRNLMNLSKGPVKPVAADDPADNPAAEFDNDFESEGVVYDDNDEPGDAYPLGYGHGIGASSTSVGDFGLDGSFDEGADPDEEDAYEAVAIPTDPNDPRIKACQTWTLEDLKSEFQKEQLDWRGLRNDTKKHRMKFLKHFELERDYSIYHEGRLRQAIKERGIIMSPSGSRADKAELVDALTEYDTQRLGEMEFAETEKTDSTEYESEPYQGSEVSGTDTSSANETPRPKKRPRDVYEEDEDEIVDDDGDEDYDDEEDDD